MFGRQYVNTRNAEKITAFAALTLALSRFAGEGTPHPNLECHSKPHPNSVFPVRPSPAALTPTLNATPSPTPLPLPSPYFPASGTVATINLCAPPNRTSSRPGK
jgi:hypothetical protein